MKNLMQEGDLVLAISASGKSPNIIRAVQYAKERNGFVIGLSGCDGGSLKTLSDININIPVNCYEQIEDLHLVIAHIIVYCFKQANK
jgi:D-sedoheptulose 7-phosphate isomerase